MSKRTRGADKKSRAPFTDERREVLSKKSKERWAKYHETHQQPIHDDKKTKKRRHPIKRDHGLGG